jgi:hypothetical protein
VGNHLAPHGRRRMSDKQGKAPVGCRTIHKGWKKVLVDKALTSNVGMLSTTREVVWCPVRKPRKLEMKIKAKRVKEVVN